MEMSRTEKAVPAMRGQVIRRCMLKQALLAPLAWIIPHGAMASEVKPAMRPASFTLASPPQMDASVLKSILKIRSERQQASTEVADTDLAEASPDMAGPIAALLVIAPDLRLVVNRREGGESSEKMTLGLRFARTF